MGNVHMEATQINYRGGSKKMSVEEAIKAAGTEITPEEKTWIDSIPTLASGKADNDVIAPEFDSEAGVYAIGDLVMHEGKLYEFTTAHETAGEWDSTEVTEKTVADEIDSLMSGLIDYEENKGVHTTSGVWSNVTYGTCRLFIPFYKANQRTIVVNSAYIYGSNAMINITDTITVVKVDSGFEIKTTDQTAVGKYGTITYTIS